MSGGQNFKIESVRSHESSTGHTRCVAAAKVAENPRLAPLPRARLSKSEEVSQKMKRLIYLILLQRGRCHLQAFPIRANLK